jgi:soluble lytic murein transglycosylase-like protein
MQNRNEKNAPAKSRAPRYLTPLLILAVCGLVLLTLVAESEAGARVSKHPVEYVNFDPNGRLGTLQMEAEAAAAQAVVKQQRLDRDMVVQTLLQAAAQEGQDPVLVLAVAMAESRLDPTITSPRGAAGLMQLMPSTAKRFGCNDPYNAYQNATCGARLLGFLLNRYSGNLQLALAAYNAGTAPVDRLSEIPPIGETQAFVQKVINLMDEIRVEMP